jgi:sulfur carrier protein ThiS
MVTVKILNYEIFNEGLMYFEIDESTTIYEILKKIDVKYGSAYEKKFNKKLLDDIVANYRIFLNNNYVTTSALAGQDVNNEDYILVLKPISGG